MVANGIRASLEDLKERVRALFASRDISKKKDCLPPKTHFSIWYFLISLLLFTYLQQYFFSPKLETIPYSQFKQHLVYGNDSLAHLLSEKEIVQGEELRQMLIARFEE
ncbi:MAG: hypothetical protein NT140_07125 [Deltaproteobacteria bacterium]|nr:hypothetical protein [Deltaproteobacteria bacterium]